MLTNTAVKFNYNPPAAPMGWPPPAQMQMQMGQRPPMQQMQGMPMPQIPMQGLQTQGIQPVARAAMPQPPVNSAPATAAAKYAAAPVGFPDPLKKSIGGTIRKFAIMCAISIVFAVLVVVIYAHTNTPPVNPVKPVVATVVQSTSNKKLGPYNPGTKWMTVPNLAISITPTSTTEQFLLIANITVSVQQTTVAFRFMRGDTPIGIGSGNTYQGSFRTATDASAYNAWAYQAMGVFLDAPPIVAAPTTTTTAAADPAPTLPSITYTLQFITYDSGRWVVFNNANGGDNADDTTCMSTLTAIRC